MGLYHHWSIRLLCLCVLLSNAYLAVNGLSTSTSGVTTSQPGTTVPTTTDNNSNTTDGSTSPPTATNEASTATEEPTTPAPGIKTVFSSTDWAVIGVTSAIPVIVFIVSILLGIYRVRHEQNVLAKKMKENLIRGRDNMAFEN